MKITITKDFRGLKKGVVYDFSHLKAFNRCTLVGDNGCGKSSLLQAFRGTVDEKDSRSMYRSDYIKLAENIKVEHEYEKILFLDAITDNGRDFMNAFDAVNFIDAGGYTAGSISHGQGTLMYIQKFINDKKDEIIPNKTLIVFDEVDHGLSLVNQAKFDNLIVNLNYKFKCDVLAISHNPFFISKSVIVYDIAKNENRSATEYIEDATGFVLVKKELIDANKIENEDIS